MAVVFGVAVLIGSGMDANAQGNSQWAHEKNRIRKQQKEYEKAQKRAAKNYYRVYRGGDYNGGYYQTDNRGVELLRQAINRGYQQGYRQGQLDRRYSRRDQYYFRQGFERGYYDGYRDETRYGYRTNNTVNILGAILGTILNVRQF
jgi:hypothetical protein